MTSLSKVYPKRIREVYAKAIRYSYLKADPNFFISQMLLISLLASLLLAFLSDLVLGFTPFLQTLLGIGIFILVHVVFYSWLLLSGESKANFVNSMLPDALRLISSNLRSGSTVDRALINSARDEFGPLKNAIDAAGTDIATGTTEEDAFRRMSKNINSEGLDRAVDLIIHGIKSGGELANILDKIADVFRNRMILSKEMRSGVLMYAIFIFFVLGLGAPVLFGISDYLVNIMATGIAKPTIAVGGDINIAGAPMLGSSEGGSVSPEFMRIYFILAMIASSITGSIILGLILAGKARSGLKYIPVLLTMSIVLFYVIEIALHSLLGEVLV